jgi:hypothetical protein
MEYEEVSLKTDRSLAELVEANQKRAALHRRLPRHKRGELFLKGPVPRDWYLLAGGLPGRASILGQELWHQAFLDGGYRTFKFKTQNFLRIYVMSALDGVRFEC